MIEETCVTGWLLQPTKLSDESEVFDVVGRTGAGAVVTINCAEKVTAEGLLRVLNGLDVVGATVDVA